MNLNLFFSFTKENSVIGTKKFRVLLLVNETQSFLQLDVSSLEKKK
jgi:hypothetical protein